MGRGRGERTWNISCFLPFSAFGHEEFIDEGAASLLPFLVRFVVVCRGEAHEPGGLAEGDFDFRHDTST
jgi:hypothetical protein